ncbi:ABC transporter permease [Bacteroidota bacterium]
MKKEMPKYAYAILKFFLPKRERDYLLPVYENIFYDLAGSKGIWAARIWYWKQVFTAAPALLWNEFYWHLVMLKNYLKTAYRGLKKNKTYSAINLAGLAVAVTAVIFISIYIQHNLEYDNFHVKVDNLYRISVITYREGVKETEGFQFTPPIGPALVNELADVKSYTRFRRPVTENFRYKDKSVKIENLLYADSTFFNLFSFDLIKGNKSRLLTDPFTIVLSESTAKRIFGGSDPIGQILSAGGNDYLVTGVAADVPSNSHIDFNALVSFETLFKLPNMYMDWKGGNQYITYVELGDGASRESVEAQFPGFLWPHINQELSKYNISYEAHLQPFKDIHLYYNPYSSALRTNLYVFGAIGIFILAIACVNFINLSTARGSRRFMEIGIRKVLGATRESMIFQFLAESTLLSFIAAVLAMGIVALLFPFFNNLNNGIFSFNKIFDYKISLGLIGFVLLTGFFSGFYPALILSGFKPARVFHDSFFSKPGKARLRGILVVFQFTISIVLVIVTLFINEQLTFIRNKNLGFDKENILAVPLTSDQFTNNLDAFRSELENISGIVNTSVSSEIPYNDFDNNGYIPEDYSTPVMINFVSTDDQYLDLFGLTLIEGRNFYKTAEGYEEGYIVNEALAERFNWDSPLGKVIERNGPHTVIGVVKDFHFAPLYKSIEPLIITNRPVTHKRLLSVKIKSGDAFGTIEEIKNRWENFSAGQAFDFYFLDEAVDAVYRNEKDNRILFLAFSVLAIVIALLGLFGLSFFTLEQKFKEIAIRKVHGASAADICIRLMNKFLLWVVLANLFAWPAAYYLINRWLENFAYKLEIGISLFIISGLISLLLAILAVVFQSTVAALKNPAESLKYE